MSNIKNFTKWNSSPTPQAPTKFNVALQTHSHSHAHNRVAKCSMYLRHCDEAIAAIALGAAAATSLQHLSMLETASLVGKLKKTLFKISLLVSLADLVFFELSYKNDSAVPHKVYDFSLTKLQVYFVATVCGFIS